MSTPAQELAGLLNRPVGALRGAAAEAHVEEIAHAVCRMLGSTNRQRLQRLQRNWPQLGEEAEDLCQGAAIAFIEAYRKDRIHPEPGSGVHTAESVGAYLWGICNRLFLQAVRRNRRHMVVLGDAFDRNPRLANNRGLEELLDGGPEEDDEARLWEVLAAVQGLCRAEDLIVTWLQGCGFSIAELQRLLRVSRHVPANSIRRVGQQVRTLLRLSAAEVNTASPSAALVKHRPPARRSKSSAPPEEATPLELLTSKRFEALLTQLASSQTRSMLLSQATELLGAEPGMPAVDATARFAQRRHDFIAAGDWSLGFLTAQERRTLFVRDARLLHGSGKPDGGAGQRVAVKNLVGEMSNIFQDLDVALLQDDLDWLLPIAEHLRSLLDFVSEFKEMRERYGALLETAQRLNSPRLEMLAQEGLCRAHLRMGDYAAARGAGRAAQQLAIQAGDRQAQASSLLSLGSVDFMEGKYGTARDEFAEALAIRSARIERSEEAVLHSNLAVIDTLLRNFSSARAHLGEALTIQRDLGDRRGEATTINRVGLVDKAEGKLSDAAEQFRAARAIHHDLGNRYDEAFALNCLGVAELFAGQPMSARESLGTALVVQRSLDNRFGIGSCLTMLGVVELFQGDLGAARERSQEALVIQREIGDRYGESSSFCTLGQVEFMQGNYAAAGAWLSQALLIFKELGTPDSCARTCLDSGAVLAALGFMQPAAVVIHGYLERAVQQGYYAAHGFPYFVRDAGIASLGSAVASGEISAEQLAQWKAEGAAMSLYELVDFTLSALGEAGRPPAGEDRPGHQPAA